MKIIQIGLNKAATTSLGQALEILNYYSLHDNETANTLVLKALNEKKDILHYINEFDAYLDNPFLSPNIYSIIDKTYLNCKFIFLTREIEEYCKRITELIMARKEKGIITNKILNSKTEKEILEQCRKGYIQRHSFARAYFKERKQDILWMNICNLGHGWTKLCSFLEKDVPGIDFPNIKPVTLK